MRDPKAAPPKQVGEALATLLDGQPADRVVLDCEEAHQPPCGIGGAFQDLIFRALAVELEKVDTVNRVRGEHIDERDGFDVD